MVKYTLVCTTFAALMAGPAHAQQHEAILKKITFQGAGFDIVVAAAKPDGAVMDLRGQPDPNVAYTANGKLVLAIDDEVQKVLKDFSVLSKPPCIFDADGRPIALFIMPNDERPANAGRAERPSPATVSLLMVKVAENLELWLMVVAVPLPILDTVVFFRVVPS